MKEPEITPEIYEEMNREFEEDGTMVRINIPSQEQIDKWLDHKEDIHTKTVEPVDMVAELWKKHNEQTETLDD